MRLPEKSRPLGRLFYLHHQTANVRQRVVNDGNETGTISTVDHAVVEGERNRQHQTRHELFTCPVQIICASDDLLVPSACSSELHAALPDSQKMVMRYGGHACNVTDPETFNALLLNGLASLLHHREAAL